MKPLYEVILLVLLASKVTFAQWVPTNGPNGGEVACLAVAPSGGADPRTLYAGAWGAGVYRSTDNGSTWALASYGISNKFIQAIAVSPTIVYAGTQNGGVFESTNGGATWSAANNGLTNTNVHALATTGRSVFAGTSGGVFRSTDDGDTWELMDIGASVNLINSISVFDTVIYVGTNGAGIFRSTNEGATWNAINNGLTNLTVQAFARFDAGPGLKPLFAGTTNGVFSSSNNGASWSLTNTGLGNGLVTALGTSGTTVVTVTIQGVYRSSDAGGSWEGFNGGLTDQYGMCLAISDSILLVGTGHSGVFLSIHFSDWKVANVGLGLSQLGWGCLGLVESDSGRSTLLAGTFSNGVAVMSSSATSWTPINYGLSSLFSLSVPSVAGIGQHLFAGTLGGLYTTTMDSLHWEWISNSSHVAAFDSVVLAGIENGDALRSTDSGSTWLTVSGARDATGFFASDDESGASQIFAIENGNSLQPSVVRSTDQGETWSPVYTTPGIGQIRCAAGWISPAGVSSMFIGMNGGGLLRSTDDGGNWSTVYANSLGIQYTNIGAIVCRQNRVFILDGDFGIAVSADNGDTWKFVNEGLPHSSSQPPYLADLITDGKNLYGATLFDGVWKRPLGEMITAVDKSGPIVSGVPGLEQNYPNPFNPSTTITYDLPKQAHLSLEVFNTLGQRVATIVNGTQRPGKYSVRFDGRGFPSGIYFYRMTAGSYVKTRSLVLLR